VVGRRWCAFENEHEIVCRHRNDFGKSQTYGLSSRAQVGDISDAPLGIVPP
jgi:hypothetical protein